MLRSSWFAPVALLAILGACNTVADAVSSAPAAVALPPALRAGFPDGSSTPQLTLVAGDDVATIALFRGTHAATIDGPGGPIPTTNKRVGFLYAAHGSRAVMDTPLLLAQLGLNPSPARPVDERGLASTMRVVASGEPGERENVARHREAFARFSKADRSMFDLIADDIVESNQSEPHDFHGKKELLAFNEAFWTGFPDIHVDVEHAFGAGEYTFLAGRLRGTNTGPMPALGIDNTGKKLDLGFFEIVRWQNGRATHSWPFMDSMDIAAQLGLM